MHSYKELQNFISKELSKQAFNEPPAALFKPIEYILSIGGKRLRPVLVLMGSELFNGEINYAIYPALGIEIFHNFTLMHDDVMDNAPFRRGKPTIHEKWNSNVAILSGDAMSITAYQYIVKCKEKHLRRVLEIFNQTAVQVCQGQQLDMEFETRDNVTIEEYMLMIKYKTAVLLGCSLKLGGILSNASPDDQTKLYDFGSSLGMAFQLQDDFLDIYGDKSTFGKKIGGDILANKKTFLLINALEKANEKDRKKLIKILHDINIVSDEKILAVKNIYDKLNIRELSLGKIQNYIHKSRILLESLSIEKSRKKEMFQLIQSLAERSV